MCKYYNNIDKKKEKNNIERERKKEMKVLLIAKKNKL